MTDEECEQWATSQLAKVRQGIASMSDEKVRAYLNDIAGWIVVLANNVDARDWEPDLHLGDVLEKHIGRTIRGRL